MSDDDAQQSKTPATPEKVLELAYIRDPKLFDRDAQTRRSKGRDELKRQTGTYYRYALSVVAVIEHILGWGDEQIEGWRIMLERNVSFYLSCAISWSINSVYKSQIRTRSCKNTNSQAINAGYSSRPDHQPQGCRKAHLEEGVRIVEAAAGVDVVEAVEGDAAADVAVVPDIKKAAVTQRGTGLGRIRTRLVEVTTIGREGTTRRWQGLVARVRL
jgi:hypothetical protein